MFGSCLEDSLPLVIIATLQTGNYVTNPIQLEGEQKFFIFILCLESIDRYWLDLIDTDATSRYHKNRPLLPIPILKYCYISSSQCR